MRISTSMRWLVVAVSAAMLLAVAAACSSETIEVPGETVVVKEEVIKTVEVPGETVVKEVVKEVMVPGETVVVKEEVVKEVMVPGETVVVEKVVTETVEVPGETVTVEVVKTVEVPGETVVVEKEVVKTVEVPGQTVVVEKEVVKTVEVPGQTVVVTKEVSGPERIVVKQVRAGYVTDPTTGKVVTAPEYGGTLTFASKSDPPTFDPLFHPSAVGAIGGVVESLVIINWGIDRNEYSVTTPSFRPLSVMTGVLAESWSQPDPLTIILNIRQGVYWHNKAPMNGRELTASDVEYTLHRVFGLGSGWTAENKPPVLFGDAVTNLPVESITATDKWTVVIKLKEPSFGALGYLLDRTPTNILPPEVIDQYGDMQDWRNVVGTGPWMLTDYVEGTSLTWTKNPDYWGHDEKYPENRLPYADELSALIMKEEATYIAALRSGKVDIIGFLGQTNINSMDHVDSLQKTNPELELWPVTQRSNNAYVMETTKPPFSDIRVRKAMQMALDHETFNNTFYKGYGLWKPQGLIGDPIVGYSTPFEEWPEELQQEYTYNPAGAEALLDDAGYPRGPDGIRFKTDVVVAEAYNDMPYTELVVGYFAQIGVEVAIDDVGDGATLGARVYSGHDYEGLAWTPSGFDYGDTLWPLSGLSVQGFNLTGDRDPAYEALYEAVQAAQTIEEQQRAAKEANMYVVENHWIIWGTKVASYGASWPWLKGYNGETDLHDWHKLGVFARLWIDQDLKKEMGY